MAHSLPPTPKESRGNSLALSCLIATLDESGRQRKEFAADFGIQESDLSKALSTQRFDLRWLDELTPAEGLDFVTRYARAKFGAFVRLPEPADLLAHVLAQVPRARRPGAAGTNRRRPARAPWSRVMAERLLSLAQVAAIYGGVSTRTIRRMVQRGEASLPAPVRLRPMQWRERDIDGRIRRMSVADQLQHESRSL